MASSNLDSNSESEYPIYPKEFKKLAIPPKDAHDTDGEFYRLVCCTPPAADCFYPTYIEQPGRESKCDNDEARLMVCGTSFFSDIKQIKRKRSIFKKALGKKKIAHGMLKPYMGKMKKTGESGHYTAWLKNESGVFKFFKEAE